LGTVRKPRAAMNRARGSLLHAAFPLSRRARPQFAARAHQQESPMPRFYDPSQPRVAKGDPYGGRWTHFGHGSIQPVYFAPVVTAAPAIARGIQAALTALTALSARLSRDKQAVLVFRARKYPTQNGRLNVEGIRVLSREEVLKNCNGLEKVEKYAQEGADKAKMAKLTPKEYGDAVHLYVEESIEKMANPKVRAEVTFVDKISAESDSASEQDSPTGAGVQNPKRVDVEEDNKRNKRGSTRVDVYEVVDDRTLCIYDVKTGRNILKRKRIEEIVDKVSRHKPEIRTVIVTEVRPAK
jgi:hypothetical protein